MPSTPLHLIQLEGGPALSAFRAQNRLQRLREREIESYLSEATDAADLENRLRRLERASLRRQLLQVAE